jgi:hypothetical protein
MTKLERRCRLLLVAYPAGYRQNRGEEIIGTLLEATPEGRAWPLARDVRGLAMGGLRARAALNRRQTTAVNLRIAVVADAAAYLAFTAVIDVSWAMNALTAPDFGARQAVWPTLLVGALLGLAVTLTWVSSRKAVQLAGVTLAAVAVTLTGPWRPWPGLPVAELACLTALALLAVHGQQPARRWLWPVALAAGVPVLPYLLPAFSVDTILTLPAVVGVMTLLWAVIDARPAVMAAVFLLALWLPTGIVGLVAGFFLPAAAPLLIVSVLAPFAVWRLHRQSARATMRRES